MRQLNNAQHLLYTQALKNPSKLTEDDLLQLIVRYPFSQPLIFAYERRKAQHKESSSNKSLALLYAPSANWLMAFVNKALVKENIPVTKMDFSFEELDHNITRSSSIDMTEEEAPEALSAVRDFMLPTVTALPPEVDSAQEENDALDLLVSQGSVAGNYFVFEEKTSRAEEDDRAIIAEVAIAAPEDAADISLYNDDLMPYSFRWWLYKTRLEHAATYQPFVALQRGPSVPLGIDFGKIEDRVIDQQIKENIIHFQNPEDKLSDQVKNRPVEVVQPKRTDFIIERFIREEPIIQAPSAANLNTENMARQSAEDNYVFVTETLANIYVDQGLLPKAIEVFRKLILKYPEKKSYFANRIKELEKNI